MKRILLSVMVFMVLAASASAQVKVTGRVIDLQNKPVSDVIVKLVSVTKTLAFGSTNAKGEYSLEVKSAPSGEVTLQFTHISYEKESLPLPPPKGGGKSIVQDMVLTPKNMQLKEVTVKPDPLRQRGDTLTHNLASFLGKGDVTLEDGLKRLPGVDVAQSGAISYMGKPISQFNIEGLDLLGGKYNLATRNIPADYVTNVEIVRNHEHPAVEESEVQAVRTGRGGGWIHGGRRRQAPSLARRDGHDVHRQVPDDLLAEGRQLQELCTGRHDRPLRRLGRKYTRHQPVRWLRWRCASAGRISLPA